MLAGGMMLAVCACGQEEQREIFTLESIETEESSSMRETETQSQQETAKALVASTEAEAAILEASIEKELLTQAEYNEKSQQLYEVWDTALNSVWDILMEALSEDEKERLIEEERAWIEVKEQAVREAGAEVAGGSIYPMVVYQKAAELTKIRVYELLKLLT